MSDYQKTDVLLIGAGIMSATLGVILQELEPSLKITILERLDHAAAESSDAWNNAGTGHSAFCELNYTPQLPDGSVEVSKAIKVAESFEISKQWWAGLIERGIMDHPEDFIRRIDHDSFVWGEKNVDYLRRRHEALSRQPLFEGMEYSHDPAKLKDWMPLVMDGRKGASEPVAATRMPIGTDVNFGALTRALLDRLKAQGNTRILFNQEVRDLEQLPADSGVERTGDALFPVADTARAEDGSARLSPFSAARRMWHVRVADVETGDRSTIDAAFVFIGAGGGALPLLLKSGIPEGRHYGGFPVSGQWLRCTNEAVIERHHAKVYGKAAVGAPPMSVPHLDTRFIDGKKALLFGPYAGFSTRFLKHGSLMDLPKSVTARNLGPMIMAGLHNVPLTRYLVEQVIQSDKDRLAALQEYLPTARTEDWELAIAGQRVQVIKKDEKEGGVLEFGTEVVAAADGTLSALLGASPGASTAVAIMLDLLAKCFPQRLKNPLWQARLERAIPSYGQKLNDHPELLREVREKSHRILGLGS